MVDWRPLHVEFEAWRRAARAATLWWRDDDAADVVPGLLRLLTIGADHRVPIACSAIPARLEPAAIRLLHTAPQITILQHGYSHDDHSADGVRKIELDGGRDLEVVGRQLRSGRRILERAFGAKALPVLVPPWHRIGRGVMARLPGWGFRGISLFTPRNAAQVVPGLIEVNTHIDLAIWGRDGPHFGGATSAVAALTSHLAARRRGRVDPEEPTGILSHHRTMCEAAWRFVTEFVTVLEDHPAAHWVSAPVLFSPGPVRPEQLPVPG